MSSEAHDKLRSDVAPESLSRTCLLTTHRDCMLVSETSYRGQGSEVPELPRKDICFQIKDNQRRPMLEPSVHVRVPRDVVIERSPPRSRCSRVECDRHRPDPKPVALIVPTDPKERNQPGRPTIADMPCFPAIVLNADPKCVEVVLLHRPQSKKSLDGLALLCVRGTRQRRSRKVKSAQLWRASHAASGREGPQPAAGGIYT